MTSEPAAQRHSAFYRFTTLVDPVAAALALRSLCVGHGLLGSVVVAREGVNGAVAGPVRQVADFEQALQQGSVLDGALRGMAFKHSACVSAPFGRLKVSVKPEIVALAWPGHTPDSFTGPAPDETDASHLAAPAWRELLARDDVVLLDNRNHFEYRLGHFRRAIDPRVNHFREFSDYVRQHAPGWRSKGRPVAMYCTGGIRCDKTAPWLRSLGLEVWQLEGGILGYLGQGLADDQDWQGECFVFDRRIALDRHLQETPTTAAQVFDARLPDEVWRLQRSLRLDAAPAVPQEVASFGENSSAGSSAPAQVHE